MTLVHDAAATVQEREDVVRVLRQIADFLDSEAGKETNVEGRLELTTPKILRQDVPYLNLIPVVSTATVEIDTCAPRSGE